MSGFEVAGVVLGVLPLAVKAAKAYMDILSSMKDAKRNLKALVHDLETEQIRLETTCEVLLDGIVPHSLIDRPVRAPLGPEWALYSDQLRLRLWTTSTKFEEQVSQMLGAVKELQAKLCMEADGSVCSLPKLTDRVAILRELRRGASFSLKKKDYEEILTRIKTANSILHDLTGQNCGLETSRKHRSQARLVALLRSLTRSIFKGLYSASTSCCAKSHTACLELEPRSTPPKVSRATGWTKSLSFKLARETSSVSATQTLVGVSRGLAVPSVVSPSTPSAHGAGEIYRPCRASDRNSDEPAVDCYGYITHSDRRFELRPLQSPQSSIGRIGRNAVTLREVILGGKPDTVLPPFEYPDKLSVAIAVSVSILHLYSTPWLPKVMSLDDIVFLPENDTTRAFVGASQTTYRPFVVQDLKAESHPSQPQPPKGPRPVNLTVLSLGALLIQLIIGKVVESLDMSGNMDMTSVLERYEAASRLNGEVLTKGGMSYAAAVKWCLDTGLEVAGLEDDRFCQNLYETVVAKLEGDAKYLTA
ncbi:hypothetical protein F5144DRAFT_519275, partial [Chaetomium tenue]